MRIKVTENHINRGRSNSCDECPIALAIIEATGFHTVAVSETGIAVLEVTHWMHYRLPAEGMWFIHNFDHGNRTVPFEFNLRPVKEPK